MARSEFPEKVRERKYRVPAHPHPLYAPPQTAKAMGMHPVKDAASAGGAGYKLVSQSPFKRYAHEDARLPLHDLPLRDLCKLLHSNNARAAAMEFRRRLNARRDMSRTSDADWKAFHVFFPSQKAKPVRRVYH